MRRLVVLAGVVVLGAAAWGAGALSAQAPAAAGQTAPAPINPANFTGLVTPHATTDIRTLRYEFARGARTNWHSHAGGQVVFVSGGACAPRSAARRCRSSAPVGSCAPKRMSCIGTGRGPTTGSRRWH